jgi:hypothetical protein
MNKEPSSLNLTLDGTAYAGLLFTKNNQCKQNMQGYLPE